MNAGEPKPDNIKAMLENIAPQLMEAKATDDSKANFLLVPIGMKAESVKKFFDEKRAVPERRIGTERADRLQSFIDITNRFKSEHSAIFAKGEITDNSIAASLMSVLDFHPAGGENTVALNKGHRVLYSFPISKEFDFWLFNNGNGMEQSEFALMLEERIIEMVTADQGDMAQVASLRPKFAEPLEILELARNLEIYSTETVQQSIKLTSGEKNLKFTAQHNGADGKPISIPDFFVLNIPVFAGSDPVRMLVRLRYRKIGDKITWFYDLYRVDRVFEDAFDASVAVVKQQTELPLYMGQTA